MKFKPISSPSLTELFIREIEDAILSGDLKIGEKLPTERELCEEMNVSRAVVNAGLNRLARKGFIRMVPRKGAYVNDYIADGNMEVMGAILEYSRGKLSKDTLEPLYTFRRSIEPFFAGETAAVLKDNTREIIQQLRDELADPSCMNHAGNTVFNFFHKVALASGNAFHPLMVKTFEPFYINIADSMCEEGYAEDLRKDLLRIADAILSGSREKAEEADLEHNDHCLIYSHLNRQS